MADHFFPYLENLKHSMSLTDMDQVIEYNNTNHYLNTNRHQQQQQQSSMLSFNQLGSSFPHDQNHFPYFPENFHVNTENLNGFLIHDMDRIHQPVPDMTTISTSDQSSHVEKKKRKSIENSSAYSSPQASDNGVAPKNSSGRGKKVKRNEKEDGELREVVHVRAKRGQATDSHSLAERVRRGKINERLRCLQDIVPGCYKTMGMAVMLDEIINYVQSLQNQVEFLSMKLTAASTVYDFNSDMDAIEKAKALETLKMQNTQSQGFPLSAQFDNLGYLPQFPHNR